MGGVVGGLISGVGTSLVGSIFGGDSSSSSRNFNRGVLQSLQGPIPLPALEGFRPIGFNAGGLRSGLTNGRIDISGSGSERQRILGGLITGFEGEATNLRVLRGLVSPGFGRLTQARRGIFDEQRARLADTARRAVGSVRENLARRRVLGSSFAQDAETRTRAEFAREERELSAQQAEAEARSFLEELSLSTELVNREFEALRSRFQVGLNELNLQIGLSTEFAGAATAQLGANARLASELAVQQAISHNQLVAGELRSQSQLQADESAGRGEFFGQAFEPFISSLSGGVRSLLDPLLNNANPNVTPGSSGTFVPRTDTAGRLFGPV